MPNIKYTLTSYEPVYAIAEEVRIPEEVIERQALQWLSKNAKKGAGSPSLDDEWISKHTTQFNSREELLAVIRFEMYKNNREIQELSDQSAICKELSNRLVEDLPEDLVTNAINDANVRLKDMLAKTGKTIESFSKERNLTEEELYEDIKERTIQSLKEDSALAAYADYKNYSLEPEDYYRIIPGEDDEDKERKRKQIEREGHLEQMSDYALKAKALHEVMKNAMIKRKETDDEWLRYGDVSEEVKEAF